MATAVEKVNYAIEQKEDIRIAANIKGAEILTTDPLSNYDDKIMNIVTASETQFYKNLNTPEYPNVADTVNITLQIPYYMSDGVTEIHDLPSGLREIKYANKLHGGPAVNSLLNFSSSTASNTSLEEIYLTGPIVFYSNKQYFYGLSNLKTINLPNATGAIHTNEFQLCPNIRTVKMPLVTGDLKFALKILTNINVSAIGDDKSDMTGFTSFVQSSNQKVVNVYINDLRGLTGIETINVRLWAIPSTLVGDEPMDYYLPPNVRYLRNPTLGHTAYTTWDNLTTTSSIHCGGLIESVEGFDTATYTFITQAFVNESNAWVNAGGTVICPVGSTTDTYFTSIGLLHTTE